MSLTKENMKSELIAKKTPLGIVGLLMGAILLPYLISIPARIILDGEYKAGLIILTLVLVGLMSNVIYLLLKIVLLKITIDEEGIKLRRFGKEWEIIFDDIQKLYVRANAVPGMDIRVNVVRGRKKSIVIVDKHKTRLMIEREYVSNFDECADMILRRAPDGVIRVRTL